LRRIYYKKGKKSVREQALDQFRATRDRIETVHPELMQNLRNSLLGAENPSTIPIDRRKNLATVLRYLELCPDATSMRQQLTDLLGK
jgi:hypothetical protein